MKSAIWSDSDWEHQRYDPFKFDSDLKAAGLTPVAYSNRRPVFADGIDINWLKVQAIAEGKDVEKGVGKPQQNDHASPHSHPAHPRKKKGKS
jgi:hypothetical protein